MGNLPIFCGMQPAFDTSLTGEPCLTSLDFHLFSLYSFRILHHKGTPMASTSLTLSPHWESFIQTEVASGRFASASEVVRAALRELEDKSKRLDALRAHLREGADQAERGEFVAGFDMSAVIARAKSGA
jgi:antitoxin ParD1/3/4